MRAILLTCAFLYVASACGGSGGGAPDSGPGGSDADTDMDTDSDSDGDTDTGTDSGSDDGCGQVDCSLPCLRFVDSGSQGAADGLSWESAFARIQPGIDSAAQQADCCEQVCQVWIASGTYYIYQYSRHDTVGLADRVQLYGGFSGEEESLEQRDWELYPTVLDGRAGPESDDAVYHVLSALESHEDQEPMEEVVLDGLVVTNGSATDYENLDETNGAGLYWVVEGDLVVRNCTFEDNEALTGGGAMILYQPSVLIQDCFFLNNVVDKDDYFGGGGGAIYFHQCPEHRVSSCWFEGNFSAVYSAMVSYQVENSLVESCIFFGNTSVNCVVGLDFFPPGFEDAVVSGSTFYGNTLFGGGLLSLDEGGRTFNSIAWNNDYRDFLPYSSHSISEDYEDPPPGPGNLYEDPLFADPENGDFRLLPGSPCIDSAHGDYASEHDYEGNPRADDPDAPNTGAGTPDYADMGAFERQP